MVHEVHVVHVVVHVEVHVVVYVVHIVHVVHVVYLNHSCSETVASKCDVQTYVQNNICSSSDAVAATNSFSVPLIPFFTCLNVCNFGILFKFLTILY